MQNITEVNSFNTTVPYVEITDPVLGGTGGESNAAAIALTNRTRYLYNYQNSFTDVQVLTAAGSISNAMLRKLIYIEVGGNTAFTLAALSTFLTGQSLTIKVKCPGGKSISITPSGSDVLTTGATTKAMEWLCDGEEITLVKRSAAAWEIIHAIGNFDKIGNDALVRKQPKNTIVAQGQLVNRVDYARLFETIQADAVSDFTWLSSGENYKGYFSLGDDVSTFRLPDMRAMHWRGLDLGRGISLARTGFGAGGYEPDGNKSHTHNTTFPYVQHTASNPLRGVTDGPGGFPANNSFTSAADGNTEATVKTIGLTPVIYY